MSTTDDDGHSGSKSGRPITFRVPSDMQSQLLAVSQLTGMSMSQLLRAGAQLIIERHLGDGDDVERAVETAQRRVAERMRLLLKSPAHGASYESAREILSYVAGQLSTRLDEFDHQDDKEATRTAAELDQVLATQRNLDPTDTEGINTVKSVYGERARQLRDEATTIVDA